jgi:hypothetical protein
VIDTGFSRALALVCAVALSGCAQLGPKYLAAGRPLYNEAVQQTDAQQLLLNIVRQRYNDPVLFLDVTNISSKATYSVTSNVTAFLPFSGLSSSGSLEPEIGPRLEDSPLIFYTPNNGEKFVRQVLTPLDPRTLTLVLQAGWSIERVLLLAGESLSGIRNAAGDDYRTLAAALRDLQRSGELTVGTDGATPPTLTLAFSPAAREMPAYQTVCKMLRASCGGEIIALRHGFSAPAAGAPTLATRSIYAALFYLAEGVDVPPGDAPSGAARARSAAGPREDLFHVLTSASEPALAAVKVRYRNVWFYIADNDGDTKVTFALLSMLLTLQAGDTTKAAPLITLPGG